ncbi:MAG TPA: hypothetical protein VHE12_01120 [bacterium]|nr:hypothetical protein [bacterium]
MSRFRRSIPLLALFALIFSFRLFFGLWQAKWGEPDYIQTYLIGLKYYSTGEWPYFGPDVNGEENPAFQSQIPGPLEGLLIGLPFHLLPIPEAPFVLLNLLNSAGLLLLAAYFHRRLPSLSMAWLALWLASLPWTLHEGTNLINPAFVLFPGAIFFVGFMEATPFFSLHWLSKPWANAFMGFGLFTAMQFHFSYVYLGPLALFAILAQMGRFRDFTVLRWFVLGALPPLALVLPTYIRYGLGTNNVAGGFAASFNWDNVRAFGTILARFLSLACYEMPRFLGLNRAARVDFLTGHPLLLVPGACLWVAGVVQPFLLLGCWFLKDEGRPQWRAAKWLILAVLLMVEVSFWFTIKKPFSHIYFILLPFVAFYAAQCFSFVADRKPWRILAGTLVVFSLFFHLLYAPVFEPQYSIYPKREQVAQAIDHKNYHLMGERRPGSLY